MATTYQALRDKIVTKLESVSDVAEVHRFPRLDFEAYPACVVIPTDGEGDFESNDEDLRNYVFDIYVYYEYKQTGKDTALDRLYDVIDDILDEFAGDKTMTGVTLPSGKTLLTAKPLAAGWDDLSDNELLQARIRVDVLVSVDT